MYVTPTEALKRAMSVAEGLQFPPLERVTVIHRTTSYRLLSLMLLPTGRLLPESPGARPAASPAPPRRGHSFQPGQTPLPPAPQPATPLHRAGHSPPPQGAPHEHASPREEQRTGSAQAMAGGTRTHARRPGFCPPLSAAEQLRGAAPATGRAPRAAGTPAASDRPSEPPSRPPHRTPWGVEQWGRHPAPPASPSAALTLRVGFGIEALAAAPVVAEQRHGGGATRGSSRPAARESRARRSGRQQPEAGQHGGPGPLPQRKKAAGAFRNLHEASGEGEGRAGSRHCAGAAARRGSRCRSQRRRRRRKVPAGGTPRGACARRGGGTRAGRGAHAQWGGAAPRGEALAAGGAGAVRALRARGETGAGVRQLWKGFQRRKGADRRRPPAVLPVPGALSRRAGLLTAPSGSGAREVPREPGHGWGRRAARLLAGAVPGPGGDALPPAKFLTLFQNVGCLSHPQKHLAT